MHILQDLVIAKLLLRYQKNNQISRLLIDQVYLSPFGYYSWDTVIVLHYAVYSCIIVLNQTHLQYTKTDHTHYLIAIDQG